MKSQFNKVKLIDGDRQSVKPQYFKMDDVSYPLRILHWYLPDTSWYVSWEYPKIKLIFLKNNYPILPDTYQESIQFILHRYFSQYFQINVN